LYKTPSTRTPLFRKPDKLSIISKQLQHYITPINQTTLFVTQIVLTIHVLTQLHKVFTPVTSCGFIQITISRVRVYIIAVRMELKTV